MTAPPPWTWSSPWTRPPRRDHSVGSADFSVGQMGAVGITTTGFPTPTVTATGLPAGLSFVDNGNGTALLSGAPDCHRHHHLDHQGQQRHQPRRRHHPHRHSGPGPAITSAATTSATTGLPFSFTVTTSGYPAPSIGATGLPAGLSFVDNGNGTATISVAPGASATGTYTVNLTATNLGGSTGQALTLDITAGEAPAITSATSANFVAGTEATFTVSAAGNPTPALAETGTLPAGLSFVDNGNGTASLSGTPVSSGTTTLEIDATNGINPPAAQALTVTVSAATPPPSTVPTAPVTPNPGPSGGGSPVVPVTAPVTAPTGTVAASPALAAPVFTSRSSLAATVGHQLTFRVSASGYPAPSLADPVLPKGLRWADDGNGTATISGVPSTLAAGKTEVPLTAANAVGNAKQMLTITVDRPAGLSSGKLPIAIAGQRYSFTVSAFGYPTPTMTESGALPAGLAFSRKANGKAVLWGLPVAGSGGAHHFSVMVSNYLGKTVAHYTLLVGEAPKITSPASAKAVHGTAFSFTVKTTGYPCPALTHTALPPGLKWTAKGNGTATISGSPSSGAAGRHIIKITAANGYGKTRLALEITVS